MALPVSPVPLVGDDQFRIAAHLGDPVQFRHNAFSWQGGVFGHRGQAFPAEVIDYTEHKEPAAVFQTVGHKVWRPSLVRSVRGRHRPPSADGAFATTTLAHRQVFLATQRIKLLSVHIPALPLEQDMQASIPEPSAL